jgi:hypothetical protein
MGPPTDDLKKALTKKYRQGTGDKTGPVPVNYYDGFVSVQIIFNLNSNVAQLHISGRGAEPKRVYPSRVGPERMG